jgi:phasin family protein
MTTTKTKTAANHAAETIEPAKQAAERVLKASAAQVEHAVTLTKQNVEKATQQVFKGYDEFASLGKETVDAVLESGSIIAKGVEQLNRSVLASAQSTFELGLEATRSMLAVKTLRELLDLQNSYAKSSVDKLIADSTKLSEMSVKVANEAFQPFNARVNATIGRFVKSAAA